MVGQKRKRSAPAAGAVAGECACAGGRRKRLAGGPDYLDALPDDLVLSILTKLAASSSAPSDLLSVHLTYVRPSVRSSFVSFVINSSCFIARLTLSHSRARDGMRGGVGAVLRFAETLGNVCDR